MEEEDVCRHWYIPVYWARWAWAQVSRTEMGRNLSEPTRLSESVCSVWIVAVYDWLVKPFVRWGFHDVTPRGYGSYDWHKPLRACYFHVHHFVKPQRTWRNETGRKEEKVVSEDLHELLFFSLCGIFQIPLFFLKSLFYMPSTFLSFQSFYSEGVSGKRIAMWIDRIQALPLTAVLLPITAAWS